MLFSDISPETTRTLVLLFQMQGHRRSAANDHSDVQAAEALVQRLTAKDGRATAVQADVSKEANVIRLVDAAATAFGRVDLVHSRLRCWVAPDRAVRLASKRAAPAPRRAAGPQWMRRC